MNRRGMIDDVGALGSGAPGPCVALDASSAETVDTKPAPWRKLSSEKRPALDGVRRVSSGGPEPGDRTLGWIARRASPRGSTAARRRRGCDVAHYADPYPQGVPRQIGDRQVLDVDHMHGCGRRTRANRPLPGEASGFGDG